MPFKKGDPKPPTSGRKKGQVNHVTKDAKLLMEELVDYGLEHAQKWLERTAKKNPARALEALAKMAEYRLPKLAKTDVDVHGGVQVLERRFYGAAPSVKVVNPAEKNLPALPDSVDADYEEK